jgi:integrase
VQAVRFYRLTLSYGCGLRAGDVVRLRLGDIDSQQMFIRIVHAAMVEGMLSAPPPNSQELRTR